MAEDYLDIVGIGAINVDYIATRTLLQRFSTDFREELRDSFESGSEKQVSLKQVKKAIEEFGRNNLEISLGGSALLTIQALASLNAQLKLGFVGVCGNVESHLPGFGGWWRREHIDDRWVLQISDEDPGLCVSYILESERTLRTTPCVNLKMAAHLQNNFDEIVKYVSRANVVHISSFLDVKTTNVLLRVLQAAKDNNYGLKVSIDPGHCWIPPNEHVSMMLKMCDYLFLNDLEFKFISQLDSIRLPQRSPLADASRIIRLCNQRTAVLHLHSYSYISMFYCFGNRIRERRFCSPVVPPDSIEDATGAGDVFSAGFLASICANGFFSTADGVQLGLRLVYKHLTSPGSSSFGAFSGVLNSFVEDILVRDEIPRRKPVVFLGHGRNALWQRVEEHLRAKLGSFTDIECFETHELPGRETLAILKKMLERSTFAVLVLTAEDATASNTMRARQNVIHEAGLFQGRLGLEKVVLLKHESIELPSNLLGLLHLEFSGNEISKTFESLDRALDAAHLFG